MPCPLTSGFPAYDCETFIGGVKRILINTFDNIASVTEADCLVSAIDDGSSTWYAYNLTDGVGLVEATHNFDVSVNTLFYEVNAQFQIFGLDSDKCSELGLLGIQRTVFIFESENGDYFLVGDERGAHRTGGTNNSSTGTAFGDAYGYNINLMATQSHDMWQVDQTVIDGLTIA